MPRESGPNEFTPEEIDEQLREKLAGDATAEELQTGDRDVDSEVAAGDVGDNESET